MQALPSGTQIGVYEIKDVLSSDWSGILYRAWNQHLNTIVTLKEYLPSNCAVREEDGVTVKINSSKDASVFEYGMEKFQEFAELLGDIQQPSVVSVHNVVQFNGTAYLAMDFVKGTLLSKKQDSSHCYTASESKQIFRLLLNGLIAVHDKNIIHGNINPSNIVIKENREPVLVNFASADIDFSDYCKQTLQTFSSGFTHTKNYHSDGLSSINSDLYSLGASMFFCLTNREPANFFDRQEAFNNNDTDPCQTVLEQVEPRLDEGLSEAILSMLSLNPELRSQSAQVILTKLDQESDKSNRKKEKVLKLNAENSWPDFLLPGLTGFVALIVAGLFWFIVQQRPEPSNLISDAGESIQQPQPVAVVIDEESADSFVNEKLFEEFDVTVGYAEEANEKTSQIQIIAANHQTSIESLVMNKEKQKSEESQDNLIIDNSELQEVAEQKKRINQFLLAAKKNVDSFNLTTPPDNNAYDQYQAVLDIDQNNIQAIEGLQQIFNIYTQFVESSISKGDFINARVYIKRAKAIQPDAPELLLLRKKLRAMNLHQEDENIPKGQGFVARNYF